MPPMVTNHLRFSWQECKLLESNGQVWLEVLRLKLVSGLGLKSIRLEFEISGLGFEAVGVVEQGYLKHPGDTGKSCQKPCSTPNGYISPFTHVDIFLVMGLPRL